MANIEYHPYCLLFPPCTEAELQTLTEDIQQNGLLEPIVLFDEKILDGRNRYLACLQSGAELKTIEFAGDDPLAYVLSKNLHRRHLTESQRAIIAANIANMQQGERTDRTFRQLAEGSQHQHQKGLTSKKQQILHVRSNYDPKTDSTCISQKEAAKIMNVSERSVNRATKVLKESSPETVQQIKEGKKTLHAALKERSNPTLGKKDKNKSRKKTIVAKELGNQSSVTIKWQDLQPAMVDLPLSDDAEYTFETICQAFGFRGNDFPRRKELAETLEALGNELEKLADWIRTIAD